MEPTVLNQITSELLCYIQNKMSTNDHESVTEFYSETDITSAKKLLFDSCEETALRLITYRVNAPKLTCGDIISKMNEVGASCPIFVAVNIVKLPIVTADAFSIAKITKDFSSILNIEQHVINSLTTLADIQNDMRAVVDKCSMIDTISGDLDILKSAVNRCIIRRRIESDYSVPESICPPRLTRSALVMMLMMLRTMMLRTMMSMMAMMTMMTTIMMILITTMMKYLKILAIVEPHSITDAAHSNDSNHDNALTAVPAQPVLCQPVLRLRDGPLHPNKWLTEGGFPQLLIRTRRLHPGHM